jgi:hypothetical protein
MNIRRAFLALITLLLIAPYAHAQSDEKRIEALADELNTLKEKLAVPDTDAELKSNYGFGPAASKVYGNNRGLSIGGYGEMYLGRFLGEHAKTNASQGDTYRFIQYLGYKFNERVLVNAEIEIEHANELALEFLYADFMVNRALNIRSGLMLMPMGITNEMHEPTTYRGNFRPETERRIIPSTWREAGLGIWGDVAGLSYRVYAVNGLLSDGFGSKGVRGGRQKGHKFKMEDIAVVARVDYNLMDLLTIGGSYYRGGADHDPSGAVETTVSIYEAHGILRTHGLELSGLYAQSSIDGASGDVPTSQNGFYVTASYDVMPHLSSGSSNQALRPFVRFEKLHLNDDEPGLNTTEITGGIEFMPATQFVVKTEFSNKTSEVDGSDAIQEARFGFGFIY